MPTFAGRPNCRILVAERSGTILGWLTLEGGQQRRRSPSAYLIMSVRPECHGGSIGSSLIREALAWAESADMVRVELVVLATNQAARRSYEMFGFEVEGQLLR